MLMDGHGSRFDIEYLQFLLWHFILLFIILPNATHLLCALDSVPFREFSRVYKKNNELASKYCRQQNISFNIVHQALIVTRSMYEAVGKSNKNGKAGLKNVGLVPWSPEKASTMEGVQYDEKEPEESEKQKARDQISPYNQTQKQKIRQYLRFGGLITDPKFFKAIQ